MTLKEKLIKEIDKLDGTYLELLLKIIQQFPREKNTDKERMAELLNELASMGGTGIKDPVEWQLEIRKDRDLPYR